MIISENDDDMDLLIDQIEGLTLHDNDIEMTFRNGVVFTFFTGMCRLDMKPQYIHSRWGESF